MGKKTTTELPKLDEWLAPWEQDKDGNPIPEEDQVIDPARLKRYLHGLQSDKINLRGQLDETSAEAEELQQKLADAKSPEDLTKLQEENARLIKERDEAKQNASKTSESDLKALRYEIALDKGLTRRQALRLVGSTKEELEEDADELLAEFGSAGEPGDREGEPEPGIARGPRRQIRNGGDPNPGGKPEEPIDYSKVVAQALNR